MFELAALVDAWKEGGEVKRNRRLPTASGRG